jgi:hypothetical protein
VVARARPVGGSARLGCAARRGVGVGGGGDGRGGFARGDEAEARGRGVAGEEAVNGSGGALRAAACMEAGAPPRGGRGRVLWLVSVEVSLPPRSGVDLEGRAGSLPLPRWAVGEAGDGDGGRGSAAAWEEEGRRLGMGESATGGGFGDVGVDDAEGGSDAVAGGDAGL